MNAKDAGKVRDAGAPTIVVNDTYVLAPWAWMLYAADWRWWQRNPLALRFAGLKVSVEAYLVDVMRLRNTGIDGFDPDPGCLRTGNNSGYQAVHCALHTKPSRVLLLGFDMKGGHWNGRQDGGVKRDWISRFSILAELMQGKVEILNCTVDSAMKCFPFVPLDEALGGN